MILTSLSMHTNVSKGGCIIMSQEKIAKLLMLVVLCYVAFPVLSFNGTLMQTVFTCAWLGFAGMLTLSLLVKKETSRKVTVKKTHDLKQKASKRMHMES
jgi:hypothetical protein